jgi:hypothetical protein
MQPWAFGFDEKTIVLPKAKEVSGIKRISTDGFDDRRPLIVFQSNLGDSSSEAYAFNSNG